MVGVGSEEIIGRVSIIFVPLCDTKSIVDISKESMSDLDIFRLCRTFFLAESASCDDEIENFLKTYLTDDTNEIKRRSEIIGVLCANDENIPTITSVMNESKRLSHALSTLTHSLRPLMTFTYMIHALKAYLASIAYMEKLFNNKCSTAIIEIADVIKTQKESPFYKDAQACVQHMDALIKPLDNATLVVNITDSGQAVQIGVTDINKQTENLVGMFGGAHDNINSLCYATQIKLRNPLSYLEEYIISQVEKQWSSPLNFSQRAFKKLNIEMLHAWYDWLKHIELYYRGLLLLEKLKKTGCFICRPEPNSNMFDSEGMQYPHMVLHDLLPVSQIFRFKLSDIVMITGANSSGKTSILKSYAQNCVFAQLGFWVPAKSFKFMPFKSWATVFAAGEDNQLHASRYQQEAERMRLVIESTSSNACLLFNEPFTSTNPAEAAELLRDIILRLRQKGTTLLFVTHIFDVYDLLLDEGVTDVRSYVTEVQSSAEKVVCSYALEEKPPDGLSYARQLAREYGLSAENLIHDSAIVKAIEDFIMGSGNHAKIV